MFSRQLENGIEVVINKIICFLVFLGFICSCSGAKFKKCEGASEDIAKIVKEDQKERENFVSLSSDKILRMYEQDKIRRERVLKIYNDSCLVTASDFSKASLIFQHGDTSDDFIKAFQLSMHAYFLGDKNQRFFIPLTIDRYLVSIGKKQLFGSQANKENNCWCLEKVEDSIDDNFRKELTGKTLKDQYEWVKSLNKNTKCESRECGKKLEANTHNEILKLILND